MWILSIKLETFRSPIKPLTKQGYGKIRKKGLITFCHNRCTYCTSFIEGNRTYSQFSTYPYPVSISMELSKSDRIRIQCTASWYTENGIGTGGTDYNTAVIGTQRNKDNFYLPAVLLVLKLNISSLDVRVQKCIIFVQIVLIVSNKLW